MTTPEDMYTQEQEPEETYTEEPQGFHESEESQESYGPQESEEPPAEESPYYVIDLSRAQELNRSLAAILLDRRCPSCKERLEANGETPSEEDHIKEIAECCSSQDGFIRAEMPMQEIVFRTILSRGNQPVNLGEIHNLVTDRWYTPINPRNISMEGLKLVLDNDVYYAFKQVSGPPEGE